MAESAIRQDEGIGLALAVTLHAGVLALLLLQPAPKPIPVPERMNVTIADTVGLTDTALAPVAPAPPQSDTTIGEPQPAPRAVAPPKPVTAPPPPKPASLPSPPRPEPAPPPPRPAPKPAAAPPKPALVKPSPQKPAAARPAPAPAPAKPAPARRAARPDPIADAVASARTSRTAPPAGRAPNAAPATRTAGASRIGNDFLQGMSGNAPAARPASKSSVSAAAIGPEVKAGLSSAIARQLKPRWVAPQGADAEQLITVLAWDLNPDGTLAGRPRLVRQEGITESNRPQAPRHVEQAIRAVELAAPFDLPEQYYAAWRRISAFQFDRKLSQ